MREQDLVQIVQQRRLRYFGHMSRMDPERYQYVVLHGRIHDHRPRRVTKEAVVGQNQRRLYRTGHITGECNSSGCGQETGETPSTTWAAGTRLHRRQSIKSSKSIILDI